MPACEVVIQVQGASGAPAPLRHAWVYWRLAGSVTVLRTDGAGRLFSAPPAADPTHPWEYNTRFTTSTGTQVEIYFSRGATPIPDPLLTTHVAVFVQRTVTLAPATGAPPVPVNPNVVNSLMRPLTSTITLPDIRLTLTKPSELAIWPLFWELPTNPYHTDGLSQGAALWGAGGLSVPENGPSPAPAAAVRPRERGLKVEGRIDAAATGVFVQILDAAGGVVSLRATIAAGASVQELAGTLGATAGDTKPFEATVFFADAQAAFGPVQIFLRSDGRTPPIIEAFLVHLAGLQVALVDDHDANANGQTRGPVRGEADETIIVDFTSSPEATLPAIQAVTRARRMIGYQFANHTRPLNPTAAAGPANPDVLHPQMPLWMGELQFVGLSQEQLRQLLERRYFTVNFGLRDPFTPQDFRLDFQWRMELSWQGPDINAPAFPALERPNQTYQYTLPVQQDLSVQLHFGHDGRFTDANVNPITVTARGEVPNAFVPAPTAIGFPVTGRRLPRVVVNGQNRPWGRAAVAAQHPAVLLEFQPSITNPAGEEILRGGDGELKLPSLSMNGQAVDPGLVPSTAGGLAAPPSADPLMRLPRFRVRGRNQSNQAEIDTISNALVEEHFNANNTLDRITLLSLACWQETLRRILAHEAGMQFDNRGTTPRRFSGVRYGHQQDMPIFGAPHGYGFGQHDSPPVTDDGAWSLVKNIKESVRRVMHDKASAAFNFLNAHMTTPADQRMRAVYQREVVRRYNGGREFQWNGAAWEISPSLAKWANSHNHTHGPNPRLNYPNGILGTAVQYSNGAGAATTFPWPIAFTAAMFGPGT